MPSSRQVLAALGAAVITSVEGAMGPAFSTTAKAGNQITMHYKQAPYNKFNDSTGNYIQYVSINGKQVHTLSTSDGHALGWGSAVECAETNCGTVPAHSWANTTIIMDKAEPNYINTLGKGEGVTGDLVTKDGGNIGLCPPSIFLSSPSPGVK